MISLHLRTCIRWCTLLVASVALFGCFGKSAPQATYYSLLSMQQLGMDDSTVTDHPDLRVGIGPVTLPDALKRIPLAVRDANNVYMFDDYHRWVGTLEKDIATVLGDNLGALTGTDRVALFPWLFHFKPTYRVIVDITQFDGDLAGDAVLIARWAVTEREGTTTLVTGRSVYRQPVLGGDYAGLVKAESLLLADFSRELARAILSAPQAN